jgi:hypothetical protein
LAGYPYLADIKKDDIAQHWFGPKTAALKKINELVK